MNQAQLELEVKVWKELAISKQVLMFSAAEALKLDPGCSQEELKRALEGVMGKIKEADAKVLSAQEQARTAITELEKRLAATAQAQAIAEATVAGMLESKEKVAAQIATERAAVAKELKQLKDRLADKEKSLKAINTALADTPENVIKKLRVLKKEKQDEAESRRRVEATLNEVRKEKRQQDQQLKDARDNSGKLVTQHRELHAVSATLHEQLKPLIADAKDLPAVPELDTQLLEAIEQPDAKPNKE